MIFAYWLKDHFRKEKDSEGAGKSLRKNTNNGTHMKTQRTLSLNQFYLFLTFTKQSGAHAVLVAASVSFVCKRSLKLRLPSTLLSLGRFWLFKPNAENMRKLVVNKNVSGEVVNKARLTY